MGPEQIGSKLVLCLKSDDNDLYIGTYGGGLSRLDRSTCELLPIDDATYPLPKTGSVFSMAHDRSGALWVATNDGLYKLCGGRVVDHVCTTDQSNTLDFVMEVYFDSLDRGWVCTRNGIGILDIDNHKVSFDAFPENFIQKEDIRDIYEGHNGNLYFIANNGNIWCFDSQLHLQPISSVLHQIPNARGVIQDYKGYIWITTANGLFRINLGDGEIRQFDSADGLESAMFNVCKPKIDEKGRLWLGNSLGLLSVDINIPIESRLSSSRVKPIAAKTEGLILSLLNSSQGIHSVINLDHNVDNFNLMLSDLAFSGSHNDRYEYSLDNGHTWLAVPDELTITFNSLPYGSTNMLVRQRGNNATETVIEIHNPYSVNSILGFCLIGLLISLSAWIIWKRRRGNHNRKEMPKENVSDGNEQCIEETNADIAYEAKSQSKKYAPNYLSDAECRTLVEKLTAILEEEKLYTNPDLKINSLSSRLGVSSHKLSYLFSQHLNTSYYDYIYQYRVAEFKRIAKEDKNGRYTLIALSEMAGFNSRATFFRIFKKSEGITPGEYLQKLREGEI
ncbi:MAG: helix-turn-helix domain-containing protein [Veillonella sp.]|nr:helix-turn-helix domain-containing protein [Veillonella sp.]